MKRLARSGFAAITATLAIACGPSGRATTTPPTPTPTPAPFGDGPAASGVESVDLCKAIELAVHALPNVTSLALEPDTIEAEADVPSRLQVEGATVTVMVGSSPDLTVTYEAGGEDMFAALKDTFSECPVFVAEEWEDYGDSSTDEGNSRIGFTYGEGNPRAVWMKVMQSGDLMVCAQTL